MSVLLKTKEPTYSRRMTVTFSRPSLSGVSIVAGPDIPYDCGDPNPRSLPGNRHKPTSKVSRIYTSTPTKIPNTSATNNATRGRNTTNPPAKTAVLARQGDCPVTIRQAGLPPDDPEDVCQWEYHISYLESRSIWI